jgi:hypothetical protein
MKRGEALNLLKGGAGGVAEWNRRRKSGEEIPNLSGVNLRMRYPIEANLSGVNLSEANLVGADLSFTKLINANLCKADLSEANLIGSDLSEALLRQANFSNARLSGANLSGADLSRAFICDAKLTGANFRAACCWNTRFADVDLSEVRGLDSVEHAGPSTIGTDTLSRSKGQIPETFLRGCGVPIALITSLPSLINAIEPIQFCSYFIRVGSKDEDFARRLHARMRKENLQAWCAPERINGGRDILEEIDRSNSVHDKLLLVLSKHSMQSAWIETELRAALRREQRDSRQTVVLIRLSDMETGGNWRCADRDIEMEVRKHHILDFSKWKDNDAFETSFALLLNVLRAEDSNDESY